MSAPTKTIDGPLHSVAAGPIDGPPMLFLHPNPMDSWSWIYQLAHLSTWYRCIAIDLPGYGRSPKAGVGLTMQEIAEACWDAAHKDMRDRPAVLVGCSVGAAVVQHMYHLRKQAVDAIALSGTGWRPGKEFAFRHIAAYMEKGIQYRSEYTMMDFSESFRVTPIASWFAAMFSERNERADVTTIIRMFEAQAAPDPPWLQSELAAPVLILSGTEDPAHDSAPALRDKFPNAELVNLQGAGHACHMEQPWTYDHELLAFLKRHGRVHSLACDDE